METNVIVFSVHTYLQLFIVCFERVKGCVKYITSVRVSLYKD